MVLVCISPCGSTALVPSARYPLLTCKTLGDILLALLQAQRLFRDRLADSDSRTRFDGMLTTQLRSVWSHTADLTGVRFGMPSLPFFFSRASISYFCNAHFLPAVLPPAWDGTRTNRCFMYPSGAEEGMLRRLALVLKRRVSNFQQRIDELHQVMAQQSSVRCSGQF